jgi:G3E family GTPase
VLHRNAFDLDRILDIEPQFLEAADDHHRHHDGHLDHDHGGLKHYHDEDMQSLSLKTEKALDPNKFFPWIQNLVAQEGAKILRSKGILAFKDDPQRFAFQGVHMMLDGDHQRDWRDSEKRESRIVFIGRELPQGLIRKGFEECVA